MALIRAAIAIVWVLVCALPVFAANGALTVTGTEAGIDAVPYFKTIETETASIVASIPGQPAPMALDAKGPGPIYRWAVMTLENPNAAPLDLVLSVPHQGLAGSGIFLPDLHGSAVLSIATTQGLLAQPLDMAGQDAYVLTVPANSSPVIALELTQPALKAAELWNRPAFDDLSQRHAFLRGANLGIGLLTAIALLSFLAVRTSPLFPAAALFGLASVAFLAVEAGYLPPGGWGGRDTAGFIGLLVECLMLTGLIAYGVILADLRRRNPLAGMIGLGLAAATLLLPIYGWFDQALAASVIRTVFVLAAVAGFVLIFRLWREGAPRSEQALIIWTAISLWTFVAAIAALSPASESTFRPLIVWGLAAVLLIMSFILAQFAFGQGFASRRFFEDAGRRALALAGAQQHVWDWQVELQDLYVSEELERDLALPEGSLSTGGDVAWLEQIHPADRGAYRAAVDAAERRGRGAFSQEFRLRRGDGAYRWFMLRARAIPGPDRRASRCIGTLSDVTEEKRSEERLLSDAVYDRVTGLPNRALFVDRLARAIADVDAGEASDLYVLLIDIDRFKTVNDGLGHEIGDSLLTVIGRRLSSLVGTEDTIARLPGDQFAVLFAGSRPKRDIIPFAETVRAAIARPVNLKPHEIFLTACLGIASYRLRGQTADALLKDAAIALYEAKRRGKDTIEFFRTTMRDDRTELVALEAELRRAVERSEIEVFYQPIARLHDMDLAGFEALVRWRHPALGLLGPESFLGLAEQTGIIRDIGAYVLGEAARQLGVWQRAFRPREPIFCAVNISSSQLIGTTLVDEIKLILGREGIRRDTFKIEVTESMVMENPELARGILDQLKQLGVGLACDDFGTGYSSLSNLRRLPFDTLKVDRSFISPDPGDDRAVIILDAIVTMARRLGLTVVAEGIESQRQIDRLTALGCDLGQGYFIGQPMTAKQIADALSSLPYTASRGRAVMSALWERAMEPEPPPIVAPPAATRHVAQPPAPSAIPPQRAGGVISGPERKAESPAPPEDSAGLPRLGGDEKTPRRPLAAGDLPRLSPAAVVAQAAAETGLPRLSANGAAAEYRNVSDDTEAGEAPVPSDRPALGRAPMAPRIVKPVQEETADSEPEEPLAEDLDEIEGAQPVDEEDAKDEDEIKPEKPKTRRKAQGKSTRKKRAVRKSGTSSQA